MWSGSWVGRYQAVAWLRTLRKGEAAAATHRRDFGSSPAGLRYHIEAIGTRDGAKTLQLLREEFSDLNRLTRW